MCVDLDGTLILSDALFETAVAVLRKNPLRALLFPFWLLGGKARFKRRLSSMCGADDLEFPFSEDVVSYVRGRVQGGAKAYLATASDSLVAGKIADRLGLFEGVFASDGAVRMSKIPKCSAGKRKTALVRGSCGRKAAIVGIPMRR